MAAILNLTQHVATKEQLDTGVREPQIEGMKELIQELLTFEDLPREGEVKERARRLAAVATDELGYDRAGTAAMIGGAPFLMGALERALKDVGVQPLYAFSCREAQEVTNPDGSVRKVAVFRHLGFVEA